MEEIVKGILILFLELGACYILGFAGCMLLFQKKQTHFFLKLIAGFLLYQVLFQICAIPCLFFDTRLSTLAIIWAVLLSLLLAVLLVRLHKPIWEDIKYLFSQIQKNPGTTVVLLAGMAAVSYYAAINGEFNEDARYYIGFINTTLTSDKMYHNNVYTGIAMESLYLRRAVVTFDIATAAACRIFAIHPLIITRITRTCLNVILTGGSVYLLGTCLFREKDSRQKACGLVILTYVLNFLFTNTMYTNATFLLTRGYEGKAFCGNVLVFFLIYSSICLARTREKRYLLLLLLGIWGSLAISSSAIMVSGATVLVFVGGYLVYQGCNYWLEKKNAKC